MLLPFIKMHGLGNDYVYIDCFRTETAEKIKKTDLPALARRISDRHFGIGSDGLVLMLPDKEADARMRIFNADGSEAEMCGNAIRCVGKYLYESGLCRRERLNIVTLSGIKTLHLQVDEGFVQSVEVNMGIPKTTPDTVMQNSIPVGFMSVNMGNPHAVFFRDTMVSDEQVSTIGQRIGTHPHFPQGTNVEFVCVRNDHEIDVRVWERGSGETLACGTGACAAAVAVMLQGWAKREVTVHLRGGDLLVRWKSIIEPVYMIGPATEVFRGEYQWEN